jgi:hypothetical protein
MDAIRIRKRLETTTLYAPELEPFIGRRVEIIVLDDEAQPPHRVVSRGFLAATVVPIGDPVAEALAELRDERSRNLTETAEQVGP